MKNKILFFKKDIFAITQLFFILSKFTLSQFKESF
jgi:hypothetical protein